MRRYGLLLAAVAVAAVGLLVTAQEKAAKPDAGAEAAIKALAVEYAKAFNAGDAKAVAAFWTTEGEMTDPDGDVHSGRAAIEAEMAEQFKTQPRATIEVVVNVVRPIARGTAMVDGRVIARLPGQPDAAETGYAAVFAREEGGWKLASLREWFPDPTNDGSLADLDWMAGEWSAKGEAGELAMKYAWDDGKVFLRGVFSVTKDGKPVAGGTHIIGHEPGTGVKGWLFATSGQVSEELWTRDGDSWQVSSTGTLPDATVMAAVNLLVRLGPDAFSWQPTARAAGTTPLPDLPPIKVTRVGKAK